MSLSLSLYIYIYIYIYNMYTYICPPRMGGQVSTAFSFFQNHRFHGSAHDLPHPSWVHVKVHVIVARRQPP